MGEKLQNAIPVTAKEELGKAVLVVYIAVIDVLLPPSLLTRQNMLV